MALGVSRPRTMQHPRVRPRLPPGAVALAAPPRGPREALLQRSPSPPHDLNEAIILGPRRQANSTGPGYRGYRPTTSLTLQTKDVLCELIELSRDRVDTLGPAPSRLRAAIGRNVDPHRDAPRWTEQVPRQRATAQTLRQPRPRLHTGGYRPTTSLTPQPKDVLYGIVELSKDEVDDTRVPGLRRGAGSDPPVPVRHW
jgi:hypothetical protein